MAKIMKPVDFPAYLKKLQGTRTDQEMADLFGVSRVTYRNAKNAAWRPRENYIVKFGFEIVYRKLDDFGFTPAELKACEGTSPPKEKAKKAAKKVTKKKK